MTEQQWIFRLTAEGQLRDSAGNLLDSEGNIVYEDSSESEKEETK